MARVHMTAYYKMHQCVYLSFFIKCPDTCSNHLTELPDVHLSSN